ncbi:glycosyltransferase [Desulfatitalea tepidiphila]|uniref:glycosyltransferase n=1 Tax=Desulfatitalea tepidiphila TaxID=1185843 RepID=UPI0009775CB0|nr:glycosyltransferase [Desulfatitalea tepidiphila]
MRLLVLTTSFPSSVYPASGVYINRMLRELPKRFVVTVLTPACDRSMDGPAASQGIRVRAIRYAPQIWQILSHRPGGIPAVLNEHRWAWALVPLFFVSLLVATIRHARRADLIHAHWSFAGLIGGIAGRWVGVPVITSLHGSDVRLAAKNRIFRRLIHWASRLNDRIVCVGNDLAGRVRPWVPAGRRDILVIPNGVEMTFGRAGKTIETPFVVAVIGNLIALKQVDVVIRAFASLPETVGRPQLLIIGDGPEMGRLQFLADELGIDYRVRFTGQVPPEQVTDYLAASDLLVLASAGEARSSVVMEAMAAGVPVVASDIEGVRELIADGERGLLFPVGDAARLAACMQRIMDDPGLGRRLAANAAQWLRAEQLTWENCAGRYVEIYEQVLAEFHQWTGR